MPICYSVGELVDKLCQVKDCNQPVKAKGYCSKHYSQYYRYGKLTPEKERDTHMVCSVDGCNNKHHSNGYCNKHNEQIRLHGHLRTDTEITRKHSNAASERNKKRFAENSSVCRSLGCEKLCYGEYCSKHNKKDKICREKYGINWQEKTAMWCAQSHRCVICGKLQSLSSVCVDHYVDQEGNPIVRGLLCKQCNVGIGNLCHNVDILRTSISYLKGEHHDNNIVYSQGELIDRLAIMELKIYHTKELLESSKTDEKEGVQNQIDNLLLYKDRILKAITYNSDENFMLRIDELNQTHLKQWHAEEKMADPEVSDEEKAKLTEQIISLNAFRMRLIAAIDEEFEKKNV